MRDILITAIILGLLPFILRSPRIGVYTWAWLAMMIPHRAAFGFARTLPFSQMVALATLISFLFSKERRPFPVNNITVVYVSLFLWMCITSLFALNRPEVIFEQWTFVLKIHLMLFVTLMLIRGRKQIEGLVWVVTLSIAFYGVKGGIYTALTGGGGRVWGPGGGMIQDNNALGLALVMLIPFLFFLYQISVRRLLRMAMLFCIITTFIAILGTQSRGAFVALIGMAFVLALKGKHPIQMSVLIGAILVIGFLAMPDSWTGRMKTIENFQQDTSAMSRIYVWKTLWALALDRPIVGGGFVVDTMAVFARYAPLEGAGVYTAGGIFVAHSIYFQALGEHGFPGLALYLLLGFLTWRKAGQLAKRYKDDPEYGSWMPLLMRMTQVSLTGFALGGAFLSLMHFDLPYYIVSFVVLVDASLRERDKAKLSGDSKLAKI